MGVVPYNSVAVEEPVPVAAPATDTVPVATPRFLIVPVAGPATDTVPVPVPVGGPPAHSPAQLSSFPVPCADVR